MNDTDSSSTRQVKTLADDPHRGHVIRMADERGEFVVQQDGFVYYHPSRGGGLDAGNLRLIAAELDLRNAEWEKNIADYFDANRS